MPRVSPCQEQEHLVGVPPWGSPKIKKLVLGRKDTFKNPEIIEMKGFEGSHITKSESHKFKLEQNNSTELLTHIRSTHLQ